jgi:peroxiredoxin
MAALGTGESAPDFRLQDTCGLQCSLSALLRKGPVVLAFLKISCPVCQFTFPYLERMHQAARGTNVHVIGVSQNSQKDTSFFRKQFGITFPVALDDPKDYLVSNAYGITNVPTVFYIGQEGQIEVSCVGWAKRDIEDIARRISEHNQAPLIAVIPPTENVPEFRGG